MGRGRQGRGKGESVNASEGQAAESRLEQRMGAAVCKVGLVRRSNGSTNRSLGVDCKSISSCPASVQSNCLDLLIGKYIYVHDRAFVTVVLRTMSEIESVRYYCMCSCMSNALVAMDRSLARSAIHDRDAPIPLPSGLCPALLPPRDRPFWVQDLSARGLGSEPAGWPDRRATFVAVGGGAKPTSWTGLFCSCLVVSRL